MDADRVEAKVVSRLLICAFSILLFDGYDIGAISYVAPFLIKEWGLSRAALGPIFSASVVGILIGAPLMGYLGDRFGRKRQIVIGGIIFGAFSWLAVLASSANELIALRFLAGLGLGAVPANTYPLISEFVPRQRTRSMIVLASTGITVGAALPAAVAAWLVPTFGWTLLFHIGGFLPLLISVVLIFALPESERFRRSNYVSGGSTPRALTPVKVSPGALFGEGIMSITLLLWLVFFMHGVSFVFLISWLPTLIASVGLPLGQASLISAMTSIGGLVAGLLIWRQNLLETHNRYLMISLLILSGVAVALLGNVGGHPTALFATVFIVGLTFNGAYACLNAIATMLYGTEVRAIGVGWASAAGRFGQIVGPLAGGFLLEGLKLPLSQVYLAAAVPMAIGALAIMALIQITDASVPLRTDHRVRDLRTP